MRFYMSPFPSLFVLASSTKVRVVGGICCFLGLFFFFWNLI